MKEKSIHVTRQVAHGIFIFLSMVLSINLLIQFSDKWFIKSAFGLLGFGFELIKLYILYLAKDRFKQKGTKNFFIASSEFSMYICLALMSIIASLGFTFVSIEEQTMRFTAQYEESNFKEEALLDEIQANKDQIKIIQENATGLEFSAVERVEVANEQITKIQNKNKELVKQIEDLREEKRSEAEVEQRLTSSDMFRLLGEPVNFSGQDTMFYMMLIFVVLLEISIAITTGEIVHGSTIKKKALINKNIKLVEYIDNLFQEDTSRLLPDGKLKDLMGISIEESKFLRKILSDITYKGKPMITIRRGGTMANYSKENMKKIVQFHLDSNNLENKLNY